MENVIDYTMSLETIINHLTELELLIEEQSLIIQQNNYLQMFLFGAIVALGLVVLLKGLM